VKTDKKGEASMTDTVVNTIPPDWKGDLARPVYPPAALAAHAGQYVVNATVTIDTNGVVTDVRPSWQRMNMPGPYSDLFFAAVRAAVSQWKIRAREERVLEEERRRRPGLPLCRDDRGQDGRAVHV
jgi:hypothetical protein